MVTNGAAPLVPADCDEGARQALGRSTTAARYVAVYFASRSDAQWFADALPATLMVRPVPVRTRCVGP